jgi:beta-barrel assembly-enhancing protease
MKILVLAAVLFGASTAGAQSSASVPAITVAQEIRARAVLAKKFESANGLAPTPQITRIEAYLQRVGDRVAAHAQRRLPYRFHFDPDPTFKSAVGLPGGQVFVGGGILTYMDTEDELAVVLGHEIEHVALGQCRDRLREELAKQRLPFGRIKSIPLDPFLASYGHDNEFAADLGGVKLAIAAGYSGSAAVRLLRMFIVQGDEMPHTSSEARANLEARISQIQPLIDAQKPAPAERNLAMPQ